MERPGDLAQLPRGHALALQLLDLGADDELIARCLDIDAEAVPPLLEIARAKLARIREIDLPEAEREATAPEPGMATGHDRRTGASDPSSTTKEIPR